MLCAVCHQVISLLQGLRKIPSNKVRKCDAFRGLDKAIKDYLNTVPLISALSHRSLRARHWHRVMERTKKSFTSPLDDREMKLQAILELSLFEFSADVEEICDQVGVGRRCQAEVTIDLRMRAHAAVGDERGENGAGLEGARRAVGDCVLGVGAVQGGLRGLFAVAVGVCFLYYARAACVRCYRFSS